MEIENCEGNKQKLDSPGDTSEYSAPTTTQLMTYKPVKVNLKRSLWVLIIDLSKLISVVSCYTSMNVVSVLRKC